MEQGTIKEVRNHTVQDANNKHYRYMALVVLVQYMRARAYDSKGVEIEIPADKEKVFGKGYLNHFAHKELDDPSRITSDKLVALLGGSAMPSSYFPQQQSKLHPHVADTFEFWGEAVKLKTMDLKKDDVIRLKTKGDSIIIDSCSKLQQTAQNYSGEDVLGGWTSKINNAKNQEQEKKPIPGENMEGVDPSEWD